MTARKVYSTEFLIFKELEKKPKTSVFGVYNIKQDDEIGRVKWHPSWRKYCFFTIPDYEFVFDEECHRDIANFLKTLNYVHKKKLGGRKYEKEKRFEQTNNRRIGKRSRNSKKENKYCKERQQTPLYYGQ